MDEKEEKRRKKLNKFTQIFQNNNVWGTIKKV